jgi:hypothetical protein
VILALILINGQRRDERELLSGHPPFVNPAVMLMQWGNTPGAPNLQGERSAIASRFRPTRGARARAPDTRAQNCAARSAQVMRGGRSRAPGGIQRSPLRRILPRPR